MKIGELKIDVQHIAYHRNGIGGAPFNVVTFDHAEDDGTGTMKLQRMVGIVFPGQDCRVAILNIDLLAAGDIAFGSNSYRGDHFEAALKSAIKAHNEAGR